MRFPILFSLVLLAAGGVCGQDLTTMIQPDVVYGHKDGMALTFDVLKPEKPNGAGILSIQSGGWYSGWREPKLHYAANMYLLSKGFTVFIVYHGSSPRFAVPDAVSDVQKCVRYIHEHAKEWSVDSKRLGVIGGSAGGHLSLMLGTTGDDHGRVAAVVALYPPTDLRGWTTNPPEEIRKHPNLKPSLTFPAEKEATVSPLLQVTPDDAPTLLIHGDKDQLVPIEHSQNIVAEMEKQKVEHQLLVIEGAAHGFSKEENASRVFPAVVNWFVSHLSPSTP